jgi:hypothetical protein
MTARSAIVGALMVVGVAACAGDGEEMASDAPMTEGAVRERAVEVTATVEAVARERREVMLRTDENRYFTATLGPEVRNFDQIETGDTVRVVYAESIVAQMAAVDASGEPTGTTVAARAPEGARPGALMGTEVTTVVTFESFDAATDTVTFTTSDGLAHSVVVEDPAMQDFAMGLEAGDRVQVTYTEAVAIAVEETSG